MEERYKVYKTLIKALVLLNLYDAIFTSIWVISGLATEANPLMSLLIEQNVLLFIATKLTLVNLGIWIVWQNIGNLFARLSVFLSFAIYFFVCVFHTIVSLLYIINV
jgi:fatty acid desaturase